MQKYTLKQRCQRHMLLIFQGFYELGATLPKRNPDRRFRVVSWHMCPVPEIVEKHC
jgi:hypothetical protein